jgi:hypothetical protein
MSQLAQAASPFDDLPGFWVFHHGLLQCAKAVVIQIVCAMAGKSGQLDKYCFHFDYTQIAYCLKMNSAYAFLKINV